MKFRLFPLPFAPLLIATGATLCSFAPASAQTVIPPTAAPIYETPPTLKASDLLTPAQLSGDLHRVRPEVTSNGLTNTYIIDSDSESFYAKGNDLVSERIREIYAIAGIRKTKGSEAYGKALGDAAKGTVDGAVNLVKDPVGSIKGVGKGAARFFKGANERVRTKTDGSDTSDDLKRYGDARRKIAGQYGVDPYSSNEVLHQEIDSLAKATGAGGLTFTLVKVAIPGGVGTAVSGLSTTDTLNNVLVEQGPYNLRAENRKRLESMGIDAPVIEAFLNHGTLNPKHQTVITHALLQLGDARGKGEYLRLAMASGSPEDAHFFQRNAELMAAYHTRKSPVVEIIDLQGLAVAYTKDRKLVLPVHLDYGSWTQIADQRSGFFEEFNRNDLAIEEREWFLSGVVSPMAKEQLESRGFVVTERALETVAP
jgi:hypothetical protein